MTSDKELRIRKMVRRLTKSIGWRNRPDPLCRRADIKRQIDNRDTGDKLYVRVSSRDCDLYETTRLVELQPCVMAFEKFTQQSLDNCDGTMYFEIMTSAEVQIFKPHSFDRAAYLAGY